MQEKNLTIREIARICGISVSTVSRAINNHYDINPETKRRVQEVIDRYGYVPNNSARNLKLSDARNIAVLVKGISNPFFTSVLRIFQDECSKREYSLVLEHVEEQQNEVEVALSLEKEKRLNGIVFLGGSPMESREKLERIQAPFVLCSIAVKDRKALERYSYVAIDDQKESEKVVDYLLETGRKRIAIITAYEEDDSIGQLRLDGYLKSMIRHGMQADPALILRPADASRTYSHENGYQCTEKLIRSGAAFDSIYAISDSIAIGAIRALRDHGFRVPEDVAVAGFDGLEIGRFMVPSLTTLEQPVEQMALESARALFGTLLGEEDGQHHCIFEGVLKKRESA